MKRERLAWFCVIVWVVAGGLYMATCFAHLQDARKATGALFTDLQDAQALASRFPHAFGTVPERPEGKGLKTQVQEAGAQTGISIAYLSQRIRTDSDGRPVEEAHARLTNARHARLVEFLRRLEEGQVGAVVKQISLRPSGDDAAVYRSVEIEVERVGPGEMR